MKRYRVCADFTLAIWECVPHESAYILDWSHLIEGGPHLGRYALAIDETLEVSESREEWILHRRTNRCECRIALPREGILEEIESRGQFLEGADE